MLDVFQKLLCECQSGTVLRRPLKILIPNISHSSKYLEVYMFRQKPEYMCDL